MQHTTCFGEEGVWLRHVLQHTVSKAKINRIIPDWPSTAFHQPEFIDELVSLAFWVYIDSDDPSPVGSQVAKTSPEPYGVILMRAPTTTHV